MKTTTSKAMSLKGNIKNLAKEKKVPPQIILQNFMFERFLQRLSLSEYRNNFIIKGGVLISCLVGLESRSTMDIDTTLKNYPLTEKDLKNIFEEIIGIQLNDNTVFLIKTIKPIREDDRYGGFRISIESHYDSIIVPISIDVTTGDVITAIDGEEVADSAYLRYELYQHQAGDTIKITYIRDGKENTVDVTLGGSN